MKYSEVVKQCVISVINNNVAFVEGHAGIGKSALANEVGREISERAKLKNVKVFTLFGSLLKEGELGGMPVPVKGEDGRMINTYTTHVVLNDIIEFCKESEEDNLAILFIDELNRCDHAVQQELMQLILEYRINTTYLPENCSIISAGNPDGFDYQVLEMNDALMDRLSYYQLESDVKEWLAWASKEENNIRPEIVEFIAEMPNLLHDPKCSDRVKPTPRSWEKLSKDYNVILDYYPNEFEDRIMESARAIVGNTCASSLISFLRNKDNPLLKPEQVFESKESDFEEYLNKIKGETATRQFVIIERIIQYLEELDSKKKLTNDNNERFIKVLNTLEKDSMIGVIRDVGANHKNLHNRFAKIEDYQDLFFECNNRAKEAQNI